MKALEKIHQIREYCDYLETHILNIEKAWKFIQKALKYDNIIYDDFLRDQTDCWVREHDLSKLSNEEFLAYVDYFHSPYGKNYDIWDDGGEGQQKHKEIKETFDKAWKHHYTNNMHHPESWKIRTDERFPNEHACHLMCMLVDWTAMSYAFNDTAESYYLKNKDEIDLPEWANKTLMKWFEMIKEYNRNTK
jgi:hypothetical protein